MQPSGRGYDHGITTFSPDGRLFQVEYARESVKRGTTTAGLKFKNGVVLVCDKRIISRLIIPESIEKMFKIDNHVGVATSGLMADARQLVARSRVEAQINRITYGATVPIDVLVKKICDFKQSFTQYGGSRPFGTALLIGGVDDNGIHLYETDPSGAYQSYHAGAIGSGRNTVIEYFEKNLKCANIDIYVDERQGKSKFGGNLVSELKLMQSMFIGNYRLLSRYSMLFGS